MSKADEMFEKLGYELQEGKFETFITDDSGNTDIIFFRKLKKVKTYKKCITIQELKAINEKCKELGWLDE